LSVNRKHLFLLHDQHSNRTWPSPIKVLRLERESDPTKTIELSIQGQAKGSEENKRRACPRLFWERCKSIFLWKNAPSVELFRKPPSNLVCRMMSKTHRQAIVNNMLKAAV
jgi:hypothetical protein